MSTRRIASHDDKPDFWKPNSPGDALYGKLLGIRIGSRGPVLSIKDFAGKVFAFGVPTQLRNIDWEEFLDLDVKITYVKSVPTDKGNPAKLYDVDVDDKE